MGAGERSVRTYLQELQARGLITIRRRGLNLTNVYVLHQFGSANSAGQDHPSRAGSANSADQERLKASTPKRPILPTTKNRGKRHREKSSKIRKATRLNCEYSADRDVIANYILDFAGEFADRAPLASSISRAQNLYQRSGLTLDQFVEVLYAARSITKERSASVREAPDESGRKSRMHYYFAVVEDVLEQPLAGHWHRQRLSREECVMGHDADEAVLVVVRVRLKEKTAKP